MIDIKFLRENPDIVKDNIKKKFQDQKLILVDEVIDLDKKNREVKLNGDNLRSERKSLSAQIGGLMMYSEMPVTAIPLTLSVPRFHRATLQCHRDMPCMRRTPRS